MRIFGAIVLLLVFLVSAASALFVSAVGTSAIHEILGAVKGLTATIALAGAFILFAMPDRSSAPGKQPPAARPYLEPTLRR